MESAWRAVLAVSGFASNHNEVASDVLGGDMGAAPERVSIYPSLNQTNRPPELSKYQSSARTPIDVLLFYSGG
jgi:hypothetical protein